MRAGRQSSRVDGHGEIGAAENIGLCRCDAELIECHAIGRQLGQRRLADRSGSHVARRRKRRVGEQMTGPHRRRIGDEQRRDTADADGGERAEGGNWAGYGRDRRTDQAGRLVERSDDHEPARPAARLAGFGELRETVVTAMENTMPARGRERTRNRERSRDIYRRQAAARQHDRDLVRHEGWRSWRHRARWRRDQARSRSRGGWSGCRRPSARRCSDPASRRRNKESPA